MTPKFTPQTAGWSAVHVGMEDDGLAIGGLEVWRCEWRRVAGDQPRLYHPAYPGQPHNFTVYEIGPEDQPERFAAAELSPGVWGFYTPDPNRRWAVSLPPRPMFRKRTNTKLV